jgi:hypothetical protein
MATVKHAIGEHDVIELLNPIGRWPVGRIGAVVSDYGAVKLVEISDQNGVALDFVQVPEAQLKLVAKHSVQAPLASNL